MTTGKTIQMFLMDGSVTGIRYVELANWTGLNVVCPKSRVPELSERIEELPVGKPTGVYLLIGAGAEPTVYIGASTDLVARLERHFGDEEKDYWNDVVLFTSKDENLTRAHAEYLEARAIETADEIGRCVLDNTQRPVRPRLAPAQRAPMDQYFENMRIVLGALGYRIMQPLTGAGGDQETDDRSEADPQQGNSLVGRTFVFSPGEAEAKGQVTDEGFVVFEGSTARGEMTDSLQHGYRAMRQELEESGKLRGAGNVMEFTQSVLFNSSSAAACVVAGGSRSGPRSWNETNTGRTLGEVEAGLTGGEE